MRRHQLRLGQRLRQLGCADDTELASRIREGGLDDRLDEVRELVAVYAIPADRVQLMPEGTSSAVLHERLAWLAPLCLQHGWRMSDRLHIHLYGDSRGT